MLVTMDLSPDQLSVSLDQEFELAIRAGTNQDFHCNAANSIVSFPPDLLDFVSLTPSGKFPNSRFFGLYEKQNGVWVLEHDNTDGDVGYTFWAPMYGSDKTKYPLVSAADGLLLGTMRFRAKAAGQARIELIHQKPIWACLFDASAPNFKRWPALGDCIVAIG